MRCGHESLDNSINKTQVAFFKRIMLPREEDLGKVQVP
jgi:hypothetical protein